jgi:hypothetical protein
MTGVTARVNVLRVAGPGFGTRAIFSVQYSWKLTLYQDVDTNAKKKTSAQTRCACID